MFKKEDPIEDLQLEITDQKSNHTLENALTSFTSMELLEGDDSYECSKCKKKTEAQRFCKINSIPEILSIQLKRFSFKRSGTKISHYVKYPETLNLEDLMFQNSIANTTTSKGRKRATIDKIASRDNVVLDLFAVVVHIGRSLSGGHYIAYVRTPIGWYRMDDASVRKAKKDEALNQTAYLLFYQKNNGEELYCRVNNRSSSGGNSNKSNSASNSNNRRKEKKRRISKRIDVSSGNSLSSSSSLRSNYNDIDGYNNHNNESQDSASGIQIPQIFKRIFSSFNY